MWGHSGEKDCTCQSLTVANGFGSPDWLRVLPADVLCIVYKHTLFYVFNLPGHLLAVKQLHLLNTNFFLSHKVSLTLSITALMNTAWVATHRSRN